jgi:hypothetical protein
VGDAGLRGSRFPASPPGRCWPTELQRDLLRAALRSGEEARQAWRAVAPDLGRPDLDPGSRRLLPLLHANREALGLPADPTDPLARAYRATRERTAAGLGDAREALGALRAAEIDGLLLKGAALVLGAYRDPGLRPMDDVDVLVPEAAAKAAVRALAARGWRPREPVTDAYRATRHAVPLVHPERTQVDLHWHVFEEHCPAATDGAFWAQARTLADPLLEGVPVRVLAPADQLLHVVVHGLKWSRIPAVRWAADAAMVLRGGPVDWDRLRAQARQRGFVLRARLALAYLRDVIGEPLPAGVLDPLAALPVRARERVELWVRSRPQPWLGSLPFHGCNYLRAAPRRTPLGLWRYLRLVWGTDSPWQMPAAFARRVARRLGSHR